jgi:hypothetical protein
MGQAILYCYRCSTQLRESHFEQGKAFRIDTRVCCAECAPEAVRTLPADLVQSLLSQLKARTESPPSSTGKITQRHASAVHRSASPASPSLQSAWIIAGLGAVILGVLGIVFFSSGSSSPEMESSRTARRPIPPSIPSQNRPSPAPAESASAQYDPPHVALKRAQEYARLHADDLFGQLREFEDLTLAGDKGEAGEEARRVSQVLRARGKVAVERALATLDVELSAPLDREAFSAALDLLRSKEGQMEWPDWKFAVNKRYLDIEDRVEKAYGLLLEKAKAAKAEGNIADLDALYGRVYTWGFDRRKKDLLDALAPIAMRPLRVVLQDFGQSPVKGMRYIGGEEFRGAKGSAALDAAVTHGGHPSFKLEGDFRGGGAYVGIYYDMTGVKNRNVRELHFWIKTATVSTIGVRLCDETNQLFQRNGGVRLAKTSEWQEVILKVSDFEGNEHWAGANDGRWHGPMKGIGINVGKGAFLTPAEQHGILWVADIEGVVIPTWTPRSP